MISENYRSLSSQWLTVMIWHVVETGQRIPVMAQSCQIMWNHVISGYSHCVQTETSGSREITTVQLHVNVSRQGKSRKEYGDLQNAQIMWNLGGIM